MKRVVIILGMHRSGISLMAKLSQCLGVYLGEKDDLMDSILDNSDGYFGNREIFRINNNILQLCNSTWYSLEPLKPDYSNHRIIEAMEEMKVILRELLEKSDTIVVSDLRISIMLPLWDKILKELEVEVNYIWVFRNPLDVMDSLRKEEGYSSKHSLLLWVRYNLSILRFLQGREYFLVNYKDILGHSQIIEELRQLLRCESDDNLKWEINYIIKHEASYSNHSDQEVSNIQFKLVLDLYNALIEHRETGVNIAEWEKRYMMEIPNIKHEFIDYEALENIQCLGEKEIIIYGAGRDGKQAAEMLQQLGFPKFNFCDKDIHKQGKNYMNGEVFSIAEVEKKKNLLVIIAVSNGIVRKEIESTLIHISGISFLSFFALKKIHKYFVSNITSFLPETDLLSEWYKALSGRADLVREACVSPVWVYQSGKVGSLTVSQSLQNAGIENAHIHRFFFKDDLGELLLGEEQIEFVHKSNFFNFHSSEYVKSIKDKVRHKKIITMVREPIAVGLSTVFQLMGTGCADRYFAANLRKGKTFSQVVAEIMVRKQDRLFNWFDEELKELCDIDVLEYPFDQEKGYTIISENEVEILLIKTEKLSQMEEIIGDFIGKSQFELTNTNVGENKQYKHIYKEIKKKLELPYTYVERYYKNNPYMDHFYSKEEQKEFLDKWADCIKEDEE